MRNTLLLAVCLLSCLNLQAQYVRDANGKAVNIYDVMHAYKTNVQPYVKHDKEKEEADKKGKYVEEDGDFQFDRWLWYWGQHTDVLGNMVSATKTWSEWVAYNKNNLRNARLTGTNSSNWTFQGPDTPVGNGTGLGRVVAMSFHPTDANTYWIGSDGGGAWKTTNNGSTWTCMTDNMPSLVVSDVDLNPLNPSTVYICTGDRDHGGWDNHLDLGVGYGIGILKSYNGGATWDTTGMTWFASTGQIANSLLINPADTSCIMLATNVGIYRSLDGGKTWVQKAAGDFKQLLYAVVDTNIIFASKSYDPSTSASGQILRSTDGGNSWTQVTSFVKVLRVGLAVSPADPKIVKALTSSADPLADLFGIEGVYTSSDTGHTFTKIYTGSCGNNILDGSSGSSHGCSGGQGQYDLMLAMDPTNVNKLYIGGINAWYSTNGGSTWNILTQWNPYASGGFTTVPVVHADKHVAVFHPLVPTRFFECNDGGVFYTDGTMSASSTWNDITRGLGITEFYGNALNNTSQAVFGGAQDNGSMIMIDHSMGQISGGDGMQCLVDPFDSGTIYTSVQYGIIYRLTDLYNTGSGTTFNRISDNIAGTSTAGAWLTPYCFQPGCNYCLVAGYDQVYYSQDQGDTWGSISPVFFPGRYISRVAMTAADSQTIYAISADSNIIHVTFDLGSTWTTIVADTIGRISNIDVDPKNKAHFWITYGGYGTHRVAEYKPITGWKKMSQGLPNVPVNCIRIDTSTRILYLGTDVGVFYKTDTGSTWELYNNGLPVVRVTDINIKYPAGELWAATYGRGMWSSPKALTVPKSVAKVAGDDVTSIVPNPNTGNFNFVSSAYYANKRVDMRLMDNMGKTIWSGAARFDGSGKVQVKTDGLAKGVYIFEAACDNEVIAKKKVVVD